MPPAPASRRLGGAHRPKLGPRRLVVCARAPRGEEDVAALGVGEGVEPPLERVARDALAEHGVDEDEDGPGRHGGIAERRHHADGLHAELAEDGDVGLAAEEPERGGGEHAREERAERAAHEVHGGDVERVVELQRAPQAALGEEAHRRAAGADDERRGGADEPRRRGDGGKPRDGAGDGAERLRSPLEPPLDEQPREPARGGGDVGDGHRHGGVGVRANPRSPR